MKKYNILIFGSNTQSQILAARLSLCGHSVSFCSDAVTASWINDCGITLIDGQSLSSSTVFIEAYTKSKPLINRPFDFIFVATSRLEVYPILEDLVLLSKKNPNCPLVFMTIAFMGFADLEKALGRENMAFCAISAGGYQTDEGIFCMMGNSFEKMFRPSACGEFSGKKTERLLALKTLLYRCGFDLSLSFHADSWLKTHALIQAAAANALFACNADNYELSGRKDLVSLLCGAIKEGFALLEKYGLTAEPEFSSWKCLPEPLLTAACTMFFNSTCAEYTLARHFADCAKEMKSLQDEIDAFADYAKLDCPCMKELKEAASFYFDTVFLEKLVYNRA